MTDFNKTTFNQTSSLSARRTGQLLRRTLGASAVLALLGLGSTAALAEPSEHRIISLQAEAMREVANDEMQATLYSEVNDKDAANLANRINRLINQSMAIAKQYPAVKVRTGSQNTYPVYDDKQRLQSWRGRASLILTSQDFKQASDLIAQLQNTLQLENINFGVSDKQRKQVEDELVIEATKNFQRRAQMLIAPWNASKYELVNLQIGSAGGGYNPAPVMMMRAAKASGVEAQDYSGGNSDLRVTVSGSIQLQ